MRACSGRSPAIHCRPEPLLLHDAASACRQRSAISRGYRWAWYKEDSREFARSAAKSSWISPRRIEFPSPSVHRENRASRRKQRRFLPEQQPCSRGPDSLLQLPRHRETDRKSVVSGKSVSVRVDLGGRRTIQKKKNKPKK